MNYDIEDTMIHNKEISFLGTKKDKNNNDEEIFTGAVEIVTMIKQSSHINKENINRKSDERDQICNDIDRHEDDREEKMMYDAKNSAW